MHDFNNMLTVISGYTDLWLRRPALPEELREDFETVSTQAHRAARLIEQILDFSRMSVVERKPLDLVPFLKETGKLLERTIPETIKVVVEFETRDYVVSRNPSQLQEAMINLAVNARDAMLDGGVLKLTNIMVTEEDAAPAPEMGHGKWVQLDVTDTGEGIPKEIVDKIFEPFFTTKQPRRGTGLGLAQVYGIIKQHKGEIVVDSVEGSGTTFRIYLPAVETPEEKEEKRP